LSIIARHAHAHTAEIDPVSHDDEVLLAVRDDTMGVSQDASPRAQQYDDPFPLESVGWVPNLATVAELRF